jgi:hypothetical protein
MALSPVEFKQWLDRCVADAEAQGLSREDVLICLMDKVLERLILARAKLKSTTHG